MKALEQPLVQGDYTSVNGLWSLGSKVGGCRHLMKNRVWGAVSQRTDFMLFPGSLGYSLPLNCLLKLVVRSEKR